MDLEAAAAKAASQQLPPTSSVELTVEEKAVVDHFNGEFGKLNHTTAQHLQNLLTEFARCERLPTAEDFDAILQRSNNAVRTYLHVSKQTLKTIQARAHEALAAYNYFRFKRDISRDARMPEATRLVMATLLAVLLAESILNGMFFANASEFGYIEGISIAVFVSLVNVGIGFAIGKYCYPLTNQLDAKSRVVGWVSVILYAIFLVAFNLITAHYRDLAEVDPDNAVRRFLSEAIGNPLGLGFHSFVMFFVGLLAGGFSFIKGVLSDDAIPGYSALQLKMIATRDAYDQAREEASRAIVRIVDNGQSECLDLAAEAGRNVARLEVIAASIKPTREGYERVRGEISDACKRHLTLYRDRNRAIRPRDTAPAYFDRFETYPSSVSFADAGDLDQRTVKAKAVFHVLAKHVAGIADRQTERIEVAHRALDEHLEEVKNSAAEEVRERARFQVDTAPEGAEREHETV